MSHVTTIKSEVRFVDQKILLETLEEIAHELNGKVVISDNISITTRLDGVIDFIKVGDEYIPKSEMRVEKLMIKINQNYQRVAYKTVMKELGYVMSVHENVNTNIMELHATRY